MRQTTAADTDTESSSVRPVQYILQKIEKTSLPSSSILLLLQKKEKKADVELTITPTTTAVPEVEVILATAPPKKLANCRQATHARETFLG